MVNKYYQKNKERLQKKHVKDIKIFLKKKKIKAVKKAGGRYQSFTEVEKQKRRQYYQERKQKLPEYRRLFNT